MAPKISFIVVNYNTFDLTCKCIDSIQKKVKEVDYEIIVVDNASSEQCPSFKTKFNDIKLVSSNENIGFAKGNNLGIKQASGTHICLINSDAEIKFINLKEILTQINRPNIGFISAKLIYPNGKIQHNCQSLPSSIKTLVELTRLFKLLPKSIRSKYLQGRYFNYSKQGYPDWMWGTFLIFDKKTLAHFDDGKLPDQFFMYCEDIEWGFHLKKESLKNLYLPSTVIIHHSGGSLSDDKLKLIQNHMSILINEHTNWLDRIFLRFLNNRGYI